MSQIDPLVERRIEELASEVRALRERVDGLSRQVSDLVSSSPRAAAGDSEVVVSPAPGPDETERPVPDVTPTEELLPETLLSNVATVTFLLVFALVLRVIVDREVVESRLGTFLGVAYAGALIAYGYYRHARSASAIPVFSVSGTLLLFAIVFETHARFEWLSAAVAYGLLTLALVAMTVMGLRYRKAFPLTVGVLGATLVGLSLGYPDLEFSWVAALLFLANGAAYLAIRLPRCRGLVWATLAITLFFWSLWTVKLRQPLIEGTQLDLSLALSWFLPAVALFAVGYVGMVVWSVVHEGWGYPSLERVLPILNVAWAYPAARGVVVALDGTEQSVAWAGSLVAVAHIGLAIVVARQKGKEKRPTTTFSIAAVLLLAVSLPAAVSNIDVTLLIWSGVAFCLAALSWVRENRLARGLAYLFQVFVCVIAAYTGTLFALTASSWVKTLVLLILTGSCVTHYSWCRRRASAPETPFFRSAAVLLLLAAFVYGFSAARMILFALMGSWAGESPDVFQLGQSFFINAGALCLMLLALKWRNGEILAAAFFAVMAGAAKVFGYDLTHIQDLPLVLSVFVFGITAAAGSVVWKRWHRLAREADGRAEE